MSEKIKNTYFNANFSEDDEVDVISILKELWEGRKRIYKFTAVFMLLGLFVVVLTPNEYTAYSTFVSHSGDNKVGGSIGGLAAMAGISLGGIGNDSRISPDLYQQILWSIPFQKELLETPLTFDGQKNKISFKEYYLDESNTTFLSSVKKYTIGLPSFIISNLKKEPVDIKLSKSEGKLISVSYKENDLIQLLINKINLEVNDSDGYVKLSATMPSRMASAELTLKVEELLQQYVIDFKIQKSKEQLKYIKTRYDEVEKKYRDVQNRLAVYKDKNKYVNTAVNRIKIESLEDEYSLVYGVYMELAKQLEAKYLQVTEDTPVFTILNPVSVPVEKSKPRRLISLFMYSFFGVMIGVGSILLKKYYMQFKEV